jgi:glucoamylase
MGVPLRGRRTVAVAAAIATLGLACAVIGVAAPGRAAVPRLLASGIAQDPCQPGRVVPVPPGVRGSYLPGSAVLRVRGGFYTGGRHPVPATRAVLACARAAQRAGGRWLAAGLVPGRGAFRPMAERALLDLRLSGQPSGAVVAGWRPMWRYTWPRDASWVAVALAFTGHQADALRVLRFLRRVQSPDGTWAARYLPDGSGPVPDGRPAELDAAGWVPWAVWSWLAAEPGGSPATRDQLSELWPMVARAAGAAAAALTAGGLPRASMDYWEDSVEVTLGTCAPLLTGLRAAADIAVVLGDRTLASRWSSAAARLAAAMRRQFGAFGYQRLPLGLGGEDAAVTFTGPPFAPPGSGTGQAAAASQPLLTLPGGGVRPGTGWPGDATTAWPAETAFFALHDAAVGQHRAAGRLLAWLAAHRTGLGELPEQVQGGHPASVAPLPWADAAVLLALLAQQHRLPTVGSCEPGRWLAATDQAWRQKISCPARSFAPSPRSQRSAPA